MQFHDCVISGDCFFPDDFCMKNTPDLKLASKQILNGTGYLLYECFEGFRFPDGGRKVAINCSCNALDLVKETFGIGCVSK